MNLKSGLLTFFLTLTLSCGAMAQTAAEPPMPKVLQSLVADGAQYRYLGPNQGVHGWLFIKDGREQYFYVTPDGQAIISGLLYAPQGEVITSRQIQQLRQREGAAIDRLATPEKFTESGMPKTAPGQSKSDLLLQQVEDGNWFKLGSDKAPVVYSFIDPQCHHCHDFLKTVRDGKYIEDGKIQLRLLPVGIVNEESILQSAALLIDSNPGAKLFEAIDGKKGAIPAPLDINTQSVQQNLSIMQAWKLKATPFIIYKDKTGKVKIINGTPQDIKELVGELL